MTTPSDPGQEGQQDQEPDEPAAVEAPVRPRSVTYACAIWTMLGVLVVIPALLVVLRSTESLTEAARDFLERQGKQNPSPQEVDDVVRRSRVNGVVSLVIGILQLLLAFFLFGGRSWARIALCVIGGLAAVGLVLALDLVSIMQLALIILAIYLMFRRESSEFLAAHRRVMR